MTVDDAARRWLAKRGYDPKMGARPMARIIQEYIKRPLAEELLFGKLVNGGHVEVSVSDDGEKLKLDARAADEPLLVSQATDAGATHGRAVLIGRGRRSGPWSGRRASFRP